MLKLKAMIDDLSAEDLVRVAVKRYKPNLRGGIQRCFTCNRNERFRWVRREYPFLNGVTVEGVPTRKCLGCGEETVIVGIMAEIEEAVKGLPAGTKVHFDQILEGTIGGNNTGTEGR